MKRIFFSIILLSLLLCVSPIKAINIQTISAQQSSNIIKTSAFKIGEEHGITVQIRMNSDSSGRYFTIVSMHGMSCDPIIVTRTKNNTYFSHSFVYGSITYYLNLNL